MSRPTALALAAALILCVAPAFADSIDGKPFERIDRRPRTSVDGAPAILLEDRGGLGPLDACPTDEGYSRVRACSARGVF